MSNILLKKFSFWRVLLILSFVLAWSACKKENDALPPDPSDQLALDSLVASKKVIETWDVITIRAYTRGENIRYHWAANHGTLVSNDSVAVEYWACSTCVGLNTIECTVSNECGSISDTIMISVYD